MEEVKSEADTEAGAPLLQEERVVHRQDVVRYLDEVVPGVDDRIAEMVAVVRLMAASDTVDMWRGSLVKMRDALIDALDAPAATHRQQPRRASHFETRITEAANEAVRTLVRDRRPSAVVPAEGDVHVQQPDDADAERAVEEQASRRAERRESEQLSHAIIRQTNRVSAVANCEGCSAVVLCCVGCAELGALNMLAHSLACTGVALVGNVFASGAVWAFGVVQGAVSSQSSRPFASL